MRLTVSVLQNSVWVLVLCLLLTSENTARALGEHSRVTTTAYATHETRFVSVPSQPLAQHLNQLSIFFDVPFSVASHLIHNQTAPALRGNYTLEQSLRLLLAGSGLTFKLQLAKANQTNTTPAALSVSGVVILPASGKPSQPTMEEVAVIGKQEAQPPIITMPRPLSASDSLNVSALNVLPSSNLAESLQHIAGIGITREAGEGRQISLRGSIPDFTLVTINDMPMLANNDSPMDSRSQKQRDRSFDFNILPNELFQQVDVYKAWSAGLHPGGLSGTVALQTISPFDHLNANTNTLLQITPQIGFNDYTSHLATIPTKGVSGIVSHAGQHWGALLSFATSERRAEERGGNTFRWRPISLQNADLSHLPEAQGLSLAQGSVLIPRGNRSSVWRSNQTRLGLNGSLEYRNSHRHWDIDWIKGFLNNDRSEFHLYPRGDLSTPIIPGVSVLQEASINPENELVYARFANARTATESRIQHAKTNYQQAIVKGLEQINPQLRLQTLFGIEKSRFDIPIGNKLYARGESDLSFDYRPDPFFPTVQFSEDLTQATHWTIHEADLEQYRTQSLLHHGAFTATWQQNPATNPFNTTWQAGLNWQRFDHVEHNAQQDNLHRPFGAAPDDESGLPLTHIPIELTHIINTHPNTHWRALHTSAAFNWLGINADNLQANKVPVTRTFNRVTEYSRGGFIQAQQRWQDWELTTGIRFQKENVTVQSHLVSTQPQLDYQLWLPSLHLSYSASPDWQIHGGYARNFNRPLLDDLSIDPLVTPNDGLNYQFNPHLRPYQSHNLDLTFDGHFASGNRVSVSLFYKNIRDYIVTTLTTSNTALHKSNAESANLFGAELSGKWQSQHTPWGIQGQLAWQRGKVGYYDQASGERLFSKNLPYLSPVIASASLFYYDQLSNGSSWHAQLSPTYRAQYLFRVSSPNLLDEDETGFHKTWYWDASVRWELDEKWSLKLEAFNLSNEREEQYSDSADRAYNAIKSGRSLTLSATYRLHTHM